MKIIEAINSVEQTLADAGIESARLDAEVILAHLLDADRSELYLRRDDPVDAGVLKSLECATAWRSQGCPVAYITGVKEFWSIPITVREGVLIPRPDTETLVEEALGIAADTKGDLNILDLCTGSGCIAAALAAELPRARFTVTDISKDALEVARENLSAEDDRTEFLTGDLFAAIPAGRRFDIIACNPPYVREDEFPKLSRDIAGFEPRAALAAGESGLDFIRRIIEDAPEHLTPGGWLAIEVGCKQAKDATAIAVATDKYDTIRTAKDLAGIDRVILIRKEWKNS